MVEGNYELRYDKGVYSTDYGFALVRPGSGTGGQQVYSREYSWDWRNQLVKTKDNRYTVEYSYGYDGQRRDKYAVGESGSETLYFNSMWQSSASGVSREWVQSKHIFVGESRILTKSNRELSDGTTEGNLNLSPRERIR